MSSLYSNIFIVLILLTIGLATILFSLLSGLDQKKKMPSFLLAFFLADFSFDLMYRTWGMLGGFEEFPRLKGLNEPLAFVYGPVLFLYTKHLTRSVLKPVHALHFIPFALCSLYVTYITWTNPGGEYGILDDIEFQVVKFFHLMSYLVVSGIILKMFEKEYKENFSLGDALDLDWLKKLMIGFEGVLFVSFVLQLLLHYGRISSTFVSAVSSILSAAIIYAISYFGFRRLKSSLVVDSPSEETEALKDIPENEKTSVVDSSFPMEKYVQMLGEKMEQEQLFTVPDLNLQRLADALGIKSYLLTRVLNEGMNQSFFDYVNERRVEAVKEKLADPAFDNFTLLTIANECGFNSKSTFNQIFKKFTNQTPTQYKKSLKSPSSEVRTS